MSTAFAAPDCDPPEREPAPAARALPPGTCDTHFHVFGPQARYPLDPRRNYTPHECALADYQRVMRAVGIEHAVIVQPSVYGSDNRAMLQALREGGPGFAPPHTELHHGTPSAASLAALMHSWFPDQAMRTRICATNPARLYDYPQEMK